MKHRVAATAVQAAMADAAQHSQLLVHVGQTRDLSAVVMVACPARSGTGPQCSVKSAQIKSGNTAISRA